MLFRSTDTTPSPSSSTGPTPQSSGKGNEGVSAQWGKNVLSSLDKDQSRRKRRRENAKKAKAAKATAKQNERVHEDDDSHTNDPGDNDGSEDHVPPKKKTYRQAATEDEKPRGYALLQITATINGEDGGNKPLPIPKSRWLAFFGEFQSKITEGWQQNPSLLLQAPKIHWVGWRSGRGQILTKDKEGNDRLVDELDGHIIRIKGKECTLHVNFNNKELRPEGTWCGVFLPAYHLSPELEICKILAGSGFTGGTTEARTRARICSGEIGRAHV